MASRGWYAEKLHKLQKCKIVEKKEREAISAIDYDNEQEDWLNSTPNLQRRSEAPKKWQSLGSLSVSKQEKRTAIYKNAIYATMVKSGFAPEEIAARMAR